MSETDDDFYKQQDFFDNIRDTAVEEYKMELSYSDIGFSIFDFLPIRRDTTEEASINYLWQSFCSLINSNQESKSFAVMPFHLLFMIAIQYKVLRIYREQKEKYSLALTTKNPREEEIGILSPESPLTIAYLGESEIVDLLKISGLTSEDARSIKKSIIRYRNDKIAHAKGYIEQDVESKVSEYIRWLETLQHAYHQLNQNVASNWIKEKQEDDDMEQFLETHFLESCFSPRDFGDIIKSLLEAKQLDFEQWTQVVNKGLELAYDQTILALHEIAKNETDDGKRINAIQILREHGEIDEEMEKNILESGTVTSPA